jgi:Rod binding domain-containing protein
MEINALSPPPVRSLRGDRQHAAEDAAAARDVRDAYRKFVGATFYGQMLKAMRSTVGKPAYFHGGQAEEAFRGQLDQHLADRLTEASADQLADPMFRRDFPRLASALAEEEARSAPRLADLGALRRR